MALRVRLYFGNQSASAYRSVCQADVRIVRFSLIRPPRFFFSVCLRCNLLVFLAAVGVRRFQERTRTVLETMSPMKDRKFNSESIPLYEMS